ncbi:MAG: hypothetical protein AB1942_24885 [Pseudomonadota bacterium]
MIARSNPTLDDAQSALTGRDLDRLGWLVTLLPAAWIASRRRRRLLFLALSAPGFVAFFGTTYHRNFFVMAAGLALFLAASVFRLRTEPLFVRAEAADLLPCPLPRPNTRKEKPHA